MRGKGGCNTLPRHALQIKHIIKLVSGVIDSVRDGRRRGKTMRYQVSSPKSPVICAPHRSENKIPTHRCWVSYFESRDLKHQDGRGGRRLTGSEKSHFDSSAHANRLHHPVLPSSSTWSEEFWRRAQNVSKFWLFLSWNVTVGSKYLM